MTWDEKDSFGAESRPEGCSTRACVPVATWDVVIEVSVGPQWTQTRRFSGFPTPDHAASVLGSLCQKPEVISGRIERRG